SANSCGMSCTPCPVPQNATKALCTSGVCDVQCIANYKKCGTVNPTCIPQAACCTSADCAQPTGGTSMCNANNQCVPMCNSVSNTLCNNNTMCLPITNTTSCGPSCASCGAPTNGVATCDGNSCGFNCKSGYVKQVNVCTKCGGNGQPCCASAPACTGPYVCN